MRHSRRWQVEKREVVRPARSETSTATVRAGLVADCDACEMNTTGGECLIDTKCGKHKRAYNSTQQAGRLAVSPVGQKIAARFLSSYGSAFAFLEFRFCEQSYPRILWVSRCRDVADMPAVCRASRG